MTGKKALIFVALLLAFAFDSGWVKAQTAAPGFTVTASDTSMPSGGFGFIPFTLAAVNGYTGPVAVGCTPQTPPAGANIPTCNAPEPYGTGFNGVTVSLSAQAPVANQSIEIYALPASMAGRWLSRLEQNGAAGPAVAGMLMLGLGFRRRRSRWSRRLLPIAALLIGLMGIGACGSPIPAAPTLTPGVYTYTVWATGVTAPFSASTTVTVTVPPGITVL